MFRQILILVLLTASITAQTAYVLTRDPSSGGGPVFGVNLPDAAAPEGVFVQHFLRLMTPNYFAGSIAMTGTPLPPVAHEGGLAIDQITGIVYATDGLSFLSQDAHSHYALAAPAPTVALPLLAGPGGPLTGLAVDPDSGFLFVCDGGTFQVRSKTHPYPALGPVLPIPPFLGVPGATGLGFDPSTANLWATNVDGATVEFTSAGVPISAHPPIPVPHGFVRGLAVNPSQGPGSFPPYPGQNPGFRVCVTDGAKVIDALPPYDTITALAGIASHCRGLAVSADPTVMPGGYNDAGGHYWYGADPIVMGSQPTAGLSRPAINFGTPTPILATLDNAPAGALLSLIIDLIPLSLTTGGVVIGDDVLWINPFSTGYAIAHGFMTADAGGSASIVLPLDSAPAGLQFCIQWLVADASKILGVDFSDAIQIKTCYR